VGGWGFFYCMKKEGGSYYWRPISLFTIKSVSFLDE